MRQALFAATFAMLAVAGSALAAPPRKTRAKPAPAASAPAATKLSEADQKRLAAIEQFQHDIVSVVALRAEADYLLGAAILAKPFENQTPGLDFDALSERSAGAPDATPAAQWSRLALCAKDQCPNPKALAWLKEHAAGNAAVWLLELDVAAAHKDAKAAHAALAKAAAAQSYDDYYGKALGGVAKAVAVLPPLPETTAGAHGGQPDNPDSVRLFVAVNAMETHPRPDLRPVIAMCAKDAVATDATIREACSKLANTLQWGSSPIGRAVGLHIQGELDPASQAQNEQASRNLAWQMQSYSGVLQNALTGQPAAVQWLTNARSGGTELSLVLATLRDNQIALDAPMDAPPASGPAASNP